jgi:hypothetical protein
MKMKAMFDAPTITSAAMLRSKKSQAMTSKNAMANEALASTSGLGLKRNLHAPSGYVSCY